MAWGGNYVLDLTGQANEALTRYRGVKLVAETSEGFTVDQVDTLGEAGFGVVQETATAQDATDGRAVAVRVMGVSVVEAGGVVAFGDFVRFDAAGKVVVLAATTADQNCVGIALQAAAADGDWIKVALFPFCRQQRDT